MRYSPYTTEVAKRVGKAVDISPVKFDNWIRGWTGTLGRTTSELMDQLFNTGVPEVKKHWYEKAPGVKGFIAREPTGSSSRFVDEFYDLKEKAGQAYVGYRLLLKENPAEAAKYRRENIDDIRLAKPAAKVSRGMSELWDQRDRIMMSKTMTPEKKRKMIEAVDRRISQRAKNFLDHVRNTEKGAYRNAG